MKKTISILIFLLFIFSCSSDDNNDNTPATNPILIGTWKLTDISIDSGNTGDGSGTFETVSSERTITFNSDETFTSNGDICTLTTTSATTSYGSFTTTETTISPFCGIAPVSYNYTIENTFLIISYSCFEGCQARYQKL